MEALPRAPHTRIANDGRRTGACHAVIGRSHGSCSPADDVSAHWMVLGLGPGLGLGLGLGLGAGAPSAPFARPAFDSTDSQFRQLMAVSLPRNTLLARSLCGVRPLVGMDRSFAASVYSHDRRRPSQTTPVGAAAASRYAYSAARDTSVNSPRRALRMQIAGCWRTVLITCARRAQFVIAQFIFRLVALPPDLSVHVLYIPLVLRRSARVHTWRPWRSTRSWARCRMPNARVPCAV